MHPFNAIFLGLLLGAPPAEGGGNLEIRISPRTVYRLSSYALEARLPEPPPPGSSVVWNVSAGRLIQNRGPRVYWKAPGSAGAVRIGVEVTAGGAVSRHEVKVPVREASREGMVTIPAGVFTMGDTWTDTSSRHYIPTDQNKLDKPSRRVYLDEYLIDRYKVTNRKYLAFLEAALAEGLVQVTPLGVVGDHEGTPAYFYRFAMEEPPTSPKVIPDLQREILWEAGRFRIQPGSEEHPVVDVTWPGSVAFAAYYGKRLPTDAEWEKAARGTDGRRYPWGNDLPTRYHANINRHYEGPTPVGMFSPRGDSPYGVADMIGICHEWVQDWMHEDLYADQATGAPLRNPVGPDWGLERVVRGRSRNHSSLATPDEASPLSVRYDWGFEFPYGDGFAHAFTGFRTALTP